MWTAYDAFNNVYLDTDKNIYKNTDRDKAAIGRDRGAAAIWCQPMYVDMAINAVELAKRAVTKNVKKNTQHFSTTCSKATLPTISTSTSTMPT